MEDITDVYYRPAKRVFKYFNNENISDYHYLYVQSHYFQMYFEFLEICVLKHMLNSAHFFTTRIIMIRKKTEIKNKKNKTGIELELLTDFDMLLMVEKGIRGEICHTIHRCSKANNKYMKYYEKDKELSYIGIKRIYMFGQCLKSYL